MDPTIILTGILTGVGTVAAIVGTNIALFGWLRSDLREFRAEIKSELKDFEAKIDSDRRAFENKIDYWQESISRETKDFHGRLCGAKRLK